jgi:hypothetical protein
MASEEWTTAEHVCRYLTRADGYPRRAEGESVLLDHVPRGTPRILDLGTGDGRLLALLQADRPRMLAEVFELLEPGGVFANFEHVAAPSERLHVAFYAAIGEPMEDEDPSDRLLDVESQLAWLRDIGFVDVDCYWKWLEMALLIGVKPTAPA